MAGHSERWRFAADVAAQREADWSLRRQLIWRTTELAEGYEVDLATHIEHFPEVVDGLSVDGISPMLRGRVGETLVSKISLQDGGSLRLTGMLRHGRDYVAFFMRRLQLREGWAIHQRLVVDPSYRGRAIGARFVQRSLSLYDELELEEIRIRAGLTTGRWLWAQMGFEFALQAEAERACEWAEEACAALGVEVTGLNGIEAAGQLARLECEQEVSFAALVKAMPQRRDELESIAAANGIAMEETIPLGKLVMLAGEEWNGYLNLRGPQRLAFEAAVAERVAKSDSDGKE